MKYENEEALLLGLRNREQEAFESLVQQLSPRLLSTATRLLQNQADSEDVVQDSLFAAVRALDQFHGESSLYTWIYRITVNRCLAKLKERTASAAQAAPFEFHGIPAGWAEAGPSLEKRVAMRRAIERALNAVPEDLRVVLLLRDVEGYSSKEAAAQLDLSDALVRQRLHRARVALAEILRPELCDGPELTCGGKIDLLFDYLDDELPEPMRHPVQEHLDTCLTCGNLLDTYRTTVAFPRAVLELIIEQPAAPFVEATVRGLAGSYA